MLVSKCKNSVFCAQFLLFFLVGTICGTWRGLLMSYAFCAVLCAGLSPGPLILRGMLLLPLFYSLCRLACDRHAGMGASSG